MYYSCRKFATQRQVLCSCTRTSTAVYRHEKTWPSTCTSMLFARYYCCLEVVQKLGVLSTCLAGGHGCTHVMDVAARSCTQQASRYGSPRAPLLAIYISLYLPSLSMFMHVKIQGVGLQVYAVVKSPCFFMFTSSAHARCSHTLRKVRCQAPSASRLDHL